MISLPHRSRRVQSQDQPRDNMIRNMNTPSWESDPILCPTGNFSQIPKAQQNQVFFAQGPWRILGGILPLCPLCEERS